LLTLREILEKALVERVSELQGQGGRGLEESVEDSRYGGAAAPRRRRRAHRELSLAFESAQSSRSTGELMERLMAPEEERAGPGPRRRRRRRGRVAAAGGGGLGA
jgi:hypothetical protein